MNKVSTKLNIIYYLDAIGYYRFIDSRILIHRWAAEKKYDRKIEAFEEVHHLDGVKTNNQPSNLIIVSKEKHKKIHQDNLAYWGNWNGPEFNYPNISN